MPRVSVVIPAFNVANYICTTLRYALISEFQDFEIIVVDDGSTDDTGALVQGFDPRVRLIQQSNAGMSAARNKAIESSDSEYVALLDGDDIWHPRKLGAQVRLLEGRPSFGMVFTEFCPWDGLAQVAWPSELDSNRDAIVESLTGWIYHELILTNWALPSSWLVRRSAMAEVGLFLTEDNLTDDWEYIIRFSRSFEIAKLQAALVLYRQSNSQISRTLNARNHDVEMRERMLTLYGHVGPDGSQVDQAKLRDRRFRSHYNHGLGHLGRGSISVGFRELVRAFSYGFKAAAPLDIAKQIVRRAIPSRH